MLLASVTAIREFLGFDNMVDITAAITGALHTAEAELVASLRTEFGTAAVVDTFWVKGPEFKEGTHVQTEFLLSRGLLAAAPTVVAANAAAGLSGSDATTVTSAFQVDLDKGLCRDWVTAYDRQYVRFSYTSGFDADGTDPTSYDLAQVPTWLQEAAKLQALVRLADSAALTEAGIKLDVPVLAAQLRGLISRKLRYAPVALLPM